MKATPHFHIRSFFEEDARMKPFKNVHKVLILLVVVLSVVTFVQLQNVTGNYTALLVMSSSTTNPSSLQPPRLVTVVQAQQQKQGNDKASTAPSEQKVREATESTVPEENVVPPDDNDAQPVGVEQHTTTWTSLNHQAPHGKKQKKRHKHKNTVHTPSAAVADEERNAELWEPPLNASIPSIRSHVYRAHPFWNESLRENVFAQAIAVNISFTAVAHRSAGKHIHMGALDAQGRPGFVYNVTSLRSNPPLFNDTDMEEYCDPTNPIHGILQRLQILSPDTTSQDKKNDRRPSASSSRLLCAVYSAEPFHATKIPPLRETWAPQCDGFFVASNVTDPTYNAVNILRIGKERYKNMWNKVQATWGYIYDHYYADYDWFHLSGDDVWLVVDNLRHYLDSDEIFLAQSGGRADGLLPDDALQFPLFLGQTMAYWGKKNALLYNSGGPGYTLNKAALKLLVTEILPLRNSTKAIAIEDRHVASFFKNYEPNPVLPYPTRDNALGHRYNTFSPMRYHNRKMPAWYRVFNKVFNMTYGPEHWSPHAVAFHYLSPRVIRHLHALKYHCPA